MVTKHAAVIGHPIAQSLSPLLHARWLERHKINADYRAIDGQDDDQFRRLIRTLPDKGYVGMNVTLPFKRLAHDLADEMSDTARTVGAANLLVFRDGKVWADNTDVPGFIAALEAMDLAEIPRSARILGAGGAAPAIIVALKALGVEHIEVTNRTASKAMELKDHFDIECIGWAARDINLEGVDLLIN
ncbi:MAG: shikimate dehydrogenase, partial [Pseudomonadota bacterium]